MSTHSQVNHAVNQYEYLHVLGGDIVLQLTGRETEGALLLALNNYPPGAGVPVHVHSREDEVFHILQGEVEITLGGQVFTAGAGQSASLPRGIPHAWKAVGTEDVKFILVTTPSGMEDMFRELSALPPGPPDMPMIVSICRRYGIEFA
jgi:quercetin dioxygenase-like cupin family protein